MTYILGSNCSDGVVLVGDRKITLDGGASHAYEDKLFRDISWMVVGSSGVSGLFEKFRERITGFIGTPNWDNTIPTLTTEIEKITRDLNATYREILGGEVFDVLLGVKSTNGAILRYIHPFGFAEGVRRYKVIGHGEPYGAFFLKRWWQPTMTMLQVAQLGAFIVKYIQDFELDNTVGVGNGNPQIWLIPNTPIPPNSSTEQQELSHPRLPSDDQMHTIVEVAMKRLDTIKQQSWLNL
jgi:20S proteasome alpha/beta subunit